MADPTDITTSKPAVPSSAQVSAAPAVNAETPPHQPYIHDNVVVPEFTWGPVLVGRRGTLLMIPLRRAFIVKQHGKLKYPEGQACAEVQVAGEKGGSSAKMVFIGFGIALVHKFLMKACNLRADAPSQDLYTVDAAGNKVGLKGAAVSGDLSPEMLGVGYLIGPKIAS